MYFNELNIIQPILQAIEEEGYKTPTPIQEQAIPLVLKGHDLLGCAQTGTGKTAAFSIPILQKLNDHSFQGKRKIRALILTPTRELAIQIGESLNAYGRHLKLKSTVIFGGVNQNPQVNVLQSGVDILVATPGRLLDLMTQGYISLRDLEIFVLDEADRMIDMGFEPQVQAILEHMPANYKPDDEAAEAGAVQIRSANFSYMEINASFLGLEIYVSIYPINVSH
jgi:ATP-dependent RNA helicase RhlE